MATIELSKSDKKEKKYKVKIDNKTIHFGQKGADDFTKTGDVEQKKRYTNRHKKREDWNKSGIDTAGFWSKNLLWNKPTITESIKNIEKKFNLDIKLKK